MKKVISLCALIVFVVYANAQKLNLGLKGGLNLASLSSSETNDLDSRLGYNAGLFFHLPITNQIAIQPEVLYSSQGAKYDVGNSDVNLALNYVNIPVMVQAMVGSGFYAEAGPQLGILTSVSDKIDGAELGSVDKDDFKSTDISLGVGLGYKMRSGFGLGARYNFGLTDINDNGSANLKNNVFQFGLTLSLGR